MLRIFRALASRNYRVLFIGALFANTGTWIHRAAQDWLVVEISDGSPTALGMVSALQFAPLPLLGLVAGTLADRFDKRLILGAATALQLAVSIAIGALVLAETITLPVLALLSCLFGVGTAFELPCRQSFVSETVPRSAVPNAVSMNSLAFNIGRSIGPVVAGFLIATVWHHVGPLYIVHAVTTLATFTALLLLRPKDYFDSERSRAGSGIRDGLVYVGRRPHLVLTLVIMLLAGIFALNFQTLIAMLARHDLGIGADGFGLMSSILAVGAMAGAMWSARRKQTRMRHLIVPAAIFGLLVTAAAQAPTVPVFAVLVLPVGFTALLIITSSNSLMQLSAPPDMRGRMVSIYLVAMFASTPIFTPLIGQVSELIGVRWAISLFGIFLTLVTLAGASLHYRRHLRGHQDPPTDEPATPDEPSA